MIYVMLPKLFGFKKEDPMIKLLFVVVLVAAFAIADDDGCFSTEGCINPQNSGSDAVTLTLLNDWPLAEKALGLDVFVNGSTVYILGADNVLDIVQAYDVTGAPAGVMTLDPANDSCFGVAWNDDPTDDTYYTNDWSDNVLYYTDNFGSSWTTVPNPAGSNSRGMDFDGTDYWCTNGGGGGLWRFQPGTGQENIAVPEVAGNPSGLTVFPSGGNIGVAVASYSSNYIYFYEWNGSTMTFLGSASCPATCASSFGLGYSSVSNTIYWAFKDSSNVYHLGEFSFTITALERSSWGSIKTSF